MAYRAKNFGVDLLAALDRAVGKENIAVVQLNKVGVCAVVAFLFRSDDGRRPFFRAVRAFGNGNARILSAKGRVKAD